jgi:hypothetical protein
MNQCGCKLPKSYLLNEKNLTGTDVAVNYHVAVVSFF